MKPVNARWILAGMTRRSVFVKAGVLAVGMMALAPRGEAVSATGGTVVNYKLNFTNWTAHIFTTAGSTNITFTEAGDVDVLIVGGGGGGAAYRTGQYGGGGGGGQVIVSNNVSASGTVTIQVGGGGNYGYPDGIDGGDGTNSFFGAIVAAGGEGGHADTDYYGGDSGSGQSGGAGSAGNGGGGGGGGDSDAGGNGGTDWSGGQGGDGTGVSAFGGVTTEYYGGGGGGGGASNGDTGAGRGYGGLGGGGNGGYWATAGWVFNEDGEPNTGGGGGGGGDAAGIGVGGSGIVIVRYATGTYPPAPKQMKITFEGYSGGKPTLANFPALVVFSNNVDGSGFNYDYFISPNGYDLRFVEDPGDSGSLNYEIEKWDVTGASYVWVQVPEIPGDGTGCIYAKWGNSSDSDQLSCTTNGTTWDSDYKGVWHFHEASGTRYDATANNNDGAPGGNVAPVAGRISGGQYFDGDNDRIEVPNAASLNISSAITLEAWIKTTQDHSSNWGRIIDKDYRDGYILGVASHTENGKVAAVFAYDSNGNKYTTSDSAVNNGAWHHVAATYDGATQRLYVDGVLQADVETWSASMADTDSPLAFGLNRSNGPDTEDYQGTIDEARVSAAARPSNWLYACYQNQADPVAFNACDPVEDVATGGAPGIKNDPVTDVTTGSATFHGTLTETGGADVAVCVLWGDSDGGATWNWANTNWLTQPVGGWTNNSPLSTNITSGINANDVYWYTFAATNATTNKVASSSKFFITGYVTVTATVNQAQYPDTDGVFTISRPEGCTNVAVTVGYTMSAGPPTLNTDYTLSGSATLAAGQTNTQITLSQNEGGAMGMATMTLTVAGANLYPVGDPSSAAIELLEPELTDTVYVAPVGTASHTPPYNSWAKAATNIATAIAWANNHTDVDYVIVSNGTYNITAQLSITRAYTVRSFGNGVYGGLANARLTKVRANDAVRCIYITDTAAGAVLDGLTMENGRDGNNSGGGGGLRISASATVSNCVIRANTASGGSWNGGGGILIREDAAAASPLLVNCEITGNTAQNYGGGVFTYSGTPTFRNCLIAGNKVNSDNGGGIDTCFATVTLDGCTIVSNTVPNGQSGGGIYARNPPTVRNSIVYWNLQGTTANNTGGGGTYTYTCTTAPGLGGTGNTSLDPQFVNPAASDYTLKAWSPCVDKGSNQGWMIGTRDLAGNPRITNAVGVAQTVDMGAYEYQPGALEAGFVANKTEVMTPPGEVVFTAIVAGTNKDSLQYYWTFGDGNTQSGSDKGVVTNTYANPGRYTVSLAVSNAASEGSSLTRADYIDVFGPIVYVAADSATPAVPYASWATAASTIQDAIDAVQGDVVGDAGLPGIVVLVSNGTYNITSGIGIVEPIVVQSYGNGVTGGLANAAATIVQRASGTVRVLYLASADAAVDGLTIRNGNIDYGAGVYTTAGWLRNCIIRDNISPSRGGGVCVNGNVVISNCVIAANTAQGRGGAGIYKLANGYNALVVNCEITDNIHSGGEDDNGGGASYNEGDYVTFRNCLIARNRASNGGCAGLYNRGSGGFTVENCTIVSNRTTSSSVGAVRKRDNGGVYMRNTIVRYNYDAGGEYNIQHLGGTADYTYSCTTNPVVSGTGMVTDDPRFVNLAAGDYTLASDSPCIDTGSNQAWMDGATDLAGNARKIFGGADGSRASPKVDMGAYEAPEPPAAGTIILLR